MTPQFANEHMCTECYRYVHEHDERCSDGERDGEAHFHFPALCCLGCGCESFEEAHPDSDWAREVAEERAEVIGDLLDLDSEFVAPGPPLQGRGRKT